MALFAHRTAKSSLPATVRDAMTLAKGERILTFATDENTRDYVIATNWALFVLTGSGPGGSHVRTRRPWHEIDTGVWQDEIFTLTVTWAGGGQPNQWTFHDRATSLPEVLHERVQASVVASTVLDLGARRRGRAVIRQDLTTGELLPQVVLGRGVPPDNPEVQAQVAAALVDLRDQVGLPG